MHFTRSGSTMATLKKNYRSIITSYDQIYFSKLSITHNSMEIIQTVEYRNRMIIEIEKIMINTCLVTSIPVED